MEGHGTSREVKKDQNTSSSDTQNKRMTKVESTTNGFIPPNSSPYAWKLLGMQTGDNKGPILVTPAQIKELEGSPEAHKLLSKQPFVTPDQIYGLASPDPNNPFGGGDPSQSMVSSRQHHDKVIREGSTNYYYKNGQVVQEIPLQQDHRRKTEE